MNSRDKLLQRTKIDIMRHKAAFLSTIIVRVEHKWDNSIPRAATDGVTMLWNEKFFDSLSPQERVWVMCHEAMHIALQHSSREMHRDHKIYNYAADFVINLGIEYLGGRIDDVCYDTQYDGMSTNQVYDLLIKDAVKVPPNYVSDIIEKPLDPNMTPEERDAIQKRIIITAATVNKTQNQGKGLSDEVERIIESIVSPKLPWNVLLQQYVNDISREDYSWRKPNRRFMPDYYLPSLYSETISNITVAIDTSGSITNKELGVILSEISFIHQSLKPETMTIIDCDTAIRNVHHVDSFTDVKSLDFGGGGGTDLQPVFDYCDKNIPNILIYFSDLYATPITKDPDYPVIWVCNSEHEVSPIGTTIYI